MNFPKRKGKRSKSRINKGKNVCQEVKPGIKKCKAGRNVIYWNHGKNSKISIKEDLHMTNYRLSNSVINWVINRIKLADA